MKVMLSFHVDSPERSGHVSARKLLKSSPVLLPGMSISDPLFDQSVDIVGVDYCVMDDTLVVALASAKAANAKEVAYWEGAVKTHGWSPLGQEPGTYVGVVEAED